MQKENQPPATHNKAIALFAARVMVGGLFLYTGFSKLVHSPQDFAATIEAYRLTPSALLMPMAKTLPWIEFILGGFLTVGYLLRFATLGVSSLLAVFLMALTTAQLRGISLAECGCFGKGGPHFTGLQAIALDCFLLAVTLFVFLGKHHRFHLDGWVEKGRPS